VQNTSKYNDSKGNRQKCDKRQVMRRNVKATAGSTT